MIKAISKKFNIYVRKERNHTVYRNDWFEFSTGFRLPCLKISPASYFDTRAMIVLCLGWGLLFLHLPIYSKIDDSEYPQYGFYFYGDGRGIFNSIWFCWGYKVYCWRMPWSWEWYRTSNLKKNGRWVHEYRGNPMEFYQDHWKDVIKYETYPYRYVLQNGEVQNVNATVKCTEMEWRWRWLMWFPYIRRISKSIDIRFDEEVGEERGSWKGGCLGCGYELKDGETALECLRRMEKERRFER